jgi:hypothetical protein
VVQKGGLGSGKGGGGGPGCRAASRARMQRPHARPRSSPAVSLVPSWILAMATNCHRTNRENGEVDI